MENYITVDGFCEREITVERSRFIAVTAHVESEEEAAEFISKKRAEFHDARHNVFAYCLKDGITRFSDDGEPHGTAGKPILDVITGSGVTDVCVVVTRYFGGVLLGTGGLVRAYSTSAKMSLQDADKVTVVPSTKYVLICAYSDYEYLNKTVARFGEILDTDFTSQVALTIAVRDSEENVFLDTIEKIFFGKLQIARQKEKIYLKNKVF